MANKRNYEWALASVIDGFFTQDKAGGVTQRVPFSLIVSSIQGQGVFQPLGNDLTAIEAISGTGVLTRTGTNTWAVVSAVAPTDHAAEHHYGGGDQITGQNLLGLRVTDSPEFNRTTLGSELRLKRSGVQEWGLVAGSSGLELAARNSDWSAIDWPITIGHDAGGVIRLGGTTNRPVNLTYTLQMGGIDTITSTREGRFTGMRLTNLSSGQMPVCADANGQITASGETDDGTYFTSNRIFRSHNSLTRSGTTWTALQWTQGSTIRTTMLSSDGSGASACHALTMVPASTETANEDLGFLMFGQRLSGKSGTNPGLKFATSGRAVGSGGPVGGFGGQLRFEYRPDNGANLVDALRIGAFGGSTADAVETAILLRTLAGAKVAGDFVLDSTPAAGATAGDILQRDLNGRLTKATPNVFYLSAYFPESTGTTTADITKHRSSAHSGSWTLDDFSKKFHKQTGTGTLSLPTASSTYEGREYKITFHGRFNFTVSVASGEIYTLAAGASYWYDVASTTVSAGDASGENCSCDVWCDGSNWYIRW